MSGSNTLSLPSMNSNWDEGVLPASPILPDSLVRPSIGLSRALLNHLSALSEYGTLELDGRRWSSMTPNWSKRWKL
jgi:hypothetical protein